MKDLKIFPVISEEALLMDIKEQKFYDTVFVSIFDHWLTNNEANANNVFYSEDDKFILEEYFKYENRYLISLSELYDNYKIFDIRTNIFNKKDIDPTPILKQDNFIDLCKDSLREHCFFLLAIPQRASILIGNYDLTIIILTLKDFNNYQNEICNYFTKNNLYILKTQAQ